MKCQLMFSKENKKNIVNSSSTELAQGVVKAKDNDSASRRYNY